MCTRPRQWRRVTSFSGGGGGVRQYFTDKGMNFPTEAFSLQELFIFMGFVNARKGIFNTLTLSWQNM